MWFNEANNVFLNDSAPTDERFDAQSELLSRFIKGIDLIPADELLSLGSQLSNQDVSFESGELGKAIAPYKRAVDDNGRIVPIKSAAGHKSHLFLDELGIITGGRSNFWVEKLAPFGFQALKAMVENSPILNAVIVTRTRQLSSFCTPYRSHDEHPLGFVITPKDKRVGDKLTDEEDKCAKGITKFLLNCGDEEDPRVRKWVHHRDNMQTWAAKLVRDTLTCDACPIETQMTLNGKRLSGFYNVPAETVRIAYEEGYMGNDKIIAVQVWQDQVISFYRPEDLIYEVRNPRTDIMASRYGYGETEMFTRIVTAFLNTINYNMAGFDRNVLPRGFLTLFGNFDQEQLNYFKRQWNALLTGPAQRWRLPIFISQQREAGANFTKVDTEFNEMHFAKWMTFLISMVCAIYSIAPEELGFESYGARSASPLSGQDTAEKLAASRDKGLEPLVTFVEGIINEFVLPIVNDKYEFHYVGLRQTDQKEIFEEKKLVWTVDEFRKSLGDDPMEDEMLGKAPINPTLLPLYQMKMQQEMMGQDGQEEQQYGLPSNILNQLKEPGDMGKTEEGGGEQQAGQGAGNFKQAPVNGGENKLAAAEVKKSANRFRIFTEMINPWRRS